MKAVEFCYWLQGLFELSPPGQLDAKQTDLIKRHLAMVFKHEIDPSYGDEKTQAVLNALHNLPPEPKFKAPPIATDHTHIEHVKMRC